MALAWASFALKAVNMVEVVGAGTTVLSMIRRCFTPKAKTGLPKVHFPSRQWFSKVKSATGRVFE
jgi:hypothetical protein